MGHLGSIPQNLRQTPLGSKIPLALRHLAKELKHGRKLLEHVFGARLFTPAAHISMDASWQPWVSLEPYGFEPFRWIMLWHPCATTPLVPAPIQLPELCPFLRISYEYYLPPMELFAEETRQVLGEHDHELPARIRYGHVHHPSNQQV